VNILLTGGAGFIGSHLLDLLIQQGHTVSVWDNLSTGSECNIFEARANAKRLRQLSLEFHDVRYLCDFSANMFGPFDAIIHLAALGSVPRSIADPMGTFESNVVGTQAVFEFARVNGIPTVLYASSSSVYGNQAGLKFEGLDTSKPISPYAASKCFAEVQAHAYARAYGIKMVGLRFFNVFGPRQSWASQYAAVLPQFCHALLNVEPLRIFGDGQQKRTFTPVEFVTHSISRLLKKTDKLESTVVNVTDECFVLTVEALAYAVASALNKSPEMIHLPERPGDIRESIGSGSALADLIDVPTVSFRQSLQKTCTWYANRC